MTKTQNDQVVIDDVIYRINPDCIDCDGTGTDAVFGDLCHCATKIGPRGMEATLTVYDEAADAIGSTAICAECGGPMAVGKPCPMCEIKKAGALVKTVTAAFVEGMDAAAEAAKALDAMKDAMPADGEPLPSGYVLEDGSQARYGQKVECVRSPGVIGVIRCPVKMDAKGSDSNWGKVNVTLPDGTETHRTAWWLRPL